MFHRAFPEVKVSAWTIRDTYLRNGIKFKFIRRGKKPVDFNDPHYLDLFKEMYEAVRITRLKDMKLVWVDEAVFTFNKLGTRAWSSKYQSVTVKDIDFKIRTTAIIAAISEDDGLEALTMHKRSVSTPDFVDFIEHLSKKFNGRPFAIFMDNLRVHKTKIVKETWKKLNTQTIFNVPYSPEFNGIETYFSLLKGEYKKLS